MRPRANIIPSITKQHAAFDRMMARYQKEHGKMSPSDDPSQPSPERRERVAKAIQQTAWLSSITENDGDPFWSMMADAAIAVLDAKAEYRDDEGRPTKYPCPSASRREHIGKLWYEARARLADPREQWSLHWHPHFWDFISVLDAESDARVEAMREACQTAYVELYDWIAKKVSEATYNAEELGQGINAWRELADSKHNGTLASFENAVSALSTKSSPT